MRILNFSCVLLLFATTIGCGGTQSGQDAVDPQEGTLPWIEQRILAEPNNPDVYARRAAYFEQLDSVRLAEADWKRAIALNDRSGHYRIRLGDLYFRKIRLSESEEQFRQAIQIEPDSIAARVKLSELYLAQNRFKEAMAEANIALKLDPLDGSLYNLKGWIHRSAGDTDLAVSSYQTAVERDPGLYDAYISLGLLHAARRSELAFAYYENAVRLRPTSIEALYNYGVAAQDMDQDSMALALYERIKSVEPRYPLAYYNTGYILLEKRNDPTEAKTEFGRAINLLPDYTDAYYNRGLAFELLGQLDSAHRDYTQAIRLAPDHTAAALGLNRLADRGVRVKPR
ncbi:MAG: tetratricopeptide repeat protein [Flavobacteriales bacterium]|nr:tetratricopeptide repeat protein [Flavobacteriales bacterium]